jgi:AraC-like DNA-binding protein
VEAQHLSDLARLRRVRDRIDREHDRPLDVAVLARDANMSVGRLDRDFRAAYGMSPPGYVLAVRAVGSSSYGSNSVTHCARQAGGSHRSPK